MHTAEATTRRPSLADAVVGGSARLCAGISALWIFALMALICTDVVLRSFFNAPLVGVPEVVALSVPSIVFLAAGQAVRTGRFLRADFLYGPFLRRYPKAGAILSLLFDAAGLLIFWKVTEGVWPRFSTAWTTDEFFGAVGAFTAPVWPFMGAMLVGCALMTVQFAALVIVDLMRVAKPADANAAVTKTAAADPRPASRPALGWVALAAFLLVVGAGLYALLYGDLSPVGIGFVAIGGMLLLVLCGLHIATALLVLSFFGIWMVRGSPAIADRSLSLAALGSISSYSFGVIPLFILMGLLVDIANVGRDAFAVAANLLRRVRGGLGIATVFANAVFAAITGSSIASAAVFTRVATPQMIGHGYSKRFAVGCVAGSSVLGMLIPPSLLLIVYGLIAEVSVGKLFTAAVLPGLLLAGVFSLMIFLMAHFTPGQIGRPRIADEVEPITLAEFAGKLLPIVLLVAAVLGGIYTGYFTPTESGAVGAAGALLIALARRSLDWRKFGKILVECAEISASILVLIVAANLYSRMLTLTGIPQAVSGYIVAAELGMFAFLAVYLLILIVLGMFLDSVSIMLVVLPLMLPVVSALGGDLIWFGIVTTIAVEIGLLTPPFGLAVYVVKGTLPEGTATLNEIFAGALPFVAAMILVTVVVMAFPILSLALL
jgi:tripartite ATP-independent transporter DctM subunit